MSDDALLAELTRWADVMPGWDSLAGYVIVKGRIRHGHAEIPREATKAKASKVLAGIEGKMDAWPVVTLGDPEGTMGDDEWQAVIPLTDRHGVSTALVAVVTILHPLGHWVMGDGSWGEGREPVLAKVVDGEVVAMIAPVRREAHPDYVSPSE